MLLAAVLSTGAGAIACQGDPAAQEVEHPVADGEDEGCVGIEAEVRHVHLAVGEVTSSGTLHLTMTNELEAPVELALRAFVHGHDGLNRVELGTHALAAGETSLTIPAEELAGEGTEGTLRTVRFRASVLTERFAQQAVKGANMVILRKADAIYLFDDAAQAAFAAQFELVGDEEEPGLVRTVGTAFVQDGHPGVDEGDMHIPDEPDFDREAVIDLLGGNSPKVEVTQ